MNSDWWMVDGWVRGTFRVVAVGFENDMFVYGNVGEGGCRVGYGRGWSYNGFGGGG